MHLGDRAVPRLSGIPGRPGDSDITELIKEHRDELPFSDQLPTLDPPTHTDHRSLLMRLITPKRLKENEDAMWALADQALDDFLAPGHGEWIKGFSGPFTLLVIADLLGVPMEDRDKFVKGIAEHAGGGIGEPARNRWRTARSNSFTVCSPTTSATVALRLATTC